MAVENFFSPPAARNCKSTGVVRVCSQLPKKAGGGVPLAGDQIAAKSAGWAARAAPNSALAAALLVSTVPLALTSNAGHAALSKPNKISGFINKETRSYHETVEFQATKRNASIRCP